MIPTWMMCEALDQGDLIPLLQDFPISPPSTPINAVFVHNRHLAPKVRVFINFLVERMEAVSASQIKKEHN